MTTVDARCPVDTRRLLFRLKLDSPPRIVPGNLIEIACRSCPRRPGERVLHRFDISGAHIETVVV